MNVGALLARSREVVDMFERRRVNIGYLQEFNIGAKEPEYMEVRKSTSFGGVDQVRAEIE